MPAGTFFGNFNCRSWHIFNSLKNLKSLFVFTVLNIGFVCAIFLISLLFNFVTDPLSISVIKKNCFVWNKVGEDILNCSVKYINLFRSHHFLLGIFHSLNKINFCILIIPNLLFIERWIKYSHILSNDGTFDAKTNGLLIPIQG